MSTKPLTTLLTLTLFLAALTACDPPPSSQTAAPELSTTAASTTAPPTATTANTDTSTTSTSDATDSTEAPTGLVTYVIVPEESTASYIMQEEFFGLALGKYGIPEGLVDTIGTTNGIDGQFELNWDDLTTPLGENTFTVDLTTFKSNQELRDSWIRENGPEFNKYPTATFVAESLTGAPTSYTPGEEVNFQLTGQMTIHETTQPVTFDITAKLENGTVTGTATAPMKLTAYGITPPDFANTLTVADDFNIKIDFTARQP